MLFASSATAQDALSGAWRWKNFTISELSCKCADRFCYGEYWHDLEFLDCLQALRDQIGRPLKVNSGHRCLQWNAYVGGAALSQHKKIAVDISLAGHRRHHLLECARRSGFSGFGLAKTFLHLDRRLKPATWYYRGSQTLWVI